jgi:hypothetical protein
VMLTPASIFWISASESGSSSRARHCASQWSRRWSVWHLTRAALLASGVSAGVGNRSGAPHDPEFVPLS